MSIISYPNIIKCRKDDNIGWEWQVRSLCTWQPYCRYGDGEKANKIGILGWEKLGYPEASTAKTDNIAECIGWKKAKLIEY